MTIKGIRYFLLTDLLKSGEYKEAAELMEKYPEPKANMAYNRAYLDYKVNGWTKQTEGLLKEAIEENPHVPDYLLGRKKIPERKPESIGMGDDREAVDYAQEHHDLWREMELMRALEKW